MIKTEEILQARSTLHPPPFEEKKLEEEEKNTDTQSRTQLIDKFI